MRKTLKCPKFRQTYNYIITYFYLFFILNYSFYYIREFVWIIASNVGSVFNAKHLDKYIESQVQLCPTLSWIRNDFHDHTHKERHRDTYNKFINANAEDNKIRMQYQSLHTRSSIGKTNCLVCTIGRKGTQTRARCSICKVIYVINYNYI